MESVPRAYTPSGVTHLNVCKHKISTFGVYAVNFTSSFMIYTSNDHDIKTSVTRNFVYQIHT